jgi:hypothetical protein
MQVPRLSPIYQNAIRKLPKPQTLVKWNAAIPGFGVGYALRTRLRVEQIILKIPVPT